MAERRSLILQRVDLSAGKILVIFFAGLLLSTCAPGPSATPEQIAAGDLDRIISGMTLEQKIGQMFMPGFDAGYLSDSSDGFRRVARWITNYQIGGLAMFGGGPYEAVRNITRFQELSESPLLIASDFEWGAPMRLSAGTRFPENMGLGATRNPMLAHEQGIITAREARALGIHLTFSPVLDVNNNPDNPIINVRSYGEDPDLVSDFGAAYITGVQSEHVAATAKHFPGHGDTDMDSHLLLPSIDFNQQRLRNVELAPFQAAIDAGVKAMMVAHIALPNLPSGDTPATLSPYIIREVLRDSLGYEGLVISDAMNMGGIVRNYWPGESAVRAIQAGVDMILLSPDFEIAYQTVLEAARQGRISEETINASVRRILELKRFCRVDRNRYPRPATLETVLENPVHLKKARETFRESITLVKDERQTIPIDPGDVNSFVTLVITDDIRHGFPGGTFAAELSKRIDHNRVIRIGPDASRGVLREARQAVETADAAAVGVFVRFASYKGSINLPREQAEFLSEILAEETPIVTVGFGTPYLLRNFPEASTFVLPYSTSRESQRAVVEALVGETGIHGTLPVTLPAGYAYGHGLSREPSSNVWQEHPRPVILDSAFTLIQQGIADSVAPGMAVYIARDGEVLASRGFGQFTYDRNSPEVTRETIFDMASITKVMSTTPLAMQMYEQNLLHLDSPVSAYIPEFSGGMKDSVKIRHLLTHSSGLPAYLQFWILTGAKMNLVQQFFNLIKFWDVADYPQEVLDIIKHTNLVYTPGDSSIYSDLGIILMGHILEKIVHKPLDRLVQDRIYTPLGMEETRYVPARRIWEEIAPTEYDRNYRNEQIQGEVHDENAAVLGGVAGHAGLFSTIDDMGRYAQMYLSNGYYDGKKYYKSSTIEKFTARQNIVEGSTRALGWDTVSDSGSLFGEYFSPQAFCHTGYTGTSIVIDPEYDVIVILLTNRVYPTRNNWKISEFRPKFHNTVMEALFSRDRLELDRTIRSLRKEFLQRYP